MVFEIRDEWFTADYLSMKNELAKIRLENANLLMSGNGSISGLLELEAKNGVALDVVTESAKIV